MVRPTKRGALASAKMTTKSKPTPLSSSSTFDPDVSISSNASISCLGDETLDQDEPSTPTGRRSPVLDLSDLPDSDSEDAGATAGPSASNVVVCVRVRPAAVGNTTEADEPWLFNPSTSTIEATDQHPSLAKRAPSSAATTSNTLTASASSTLLADASSLSSSGDTYKFSFDTLVPPESSSLDELYRTNISPVVSGAVQGYNGTVFAYGQTGSGKTYTMSGGGGEEGIINRAINEVFEKVEQLPEREFLLRVSYLEIYNESLRDLLLSLPSIGGSLSSSDRPASPTKGGYSHSSGPPSTSAALRILEQPSSGRITIAGLREEIVTQPSQVLGLLVKGQAARHQAATDWNERSSRSHCVATLTIESRVRGSKSGAVRVSALNLIDLAGSERAATEKERRKEGAFINKSLLTLGSVISKLSTAASNPAAAAHIPYRDSKLTRILQTSLSGNARVAVLLTMSPLVQHAAEGLSTLKFGKRCKMIKLKAKRGEVGEGDVANEALLRRYKREVERLRAKLEADVAAASTPPAISAPEDEGDMLKLAARKRDAQEEVEGMTRRKAELRAQMEHLTRLIVTSGTVAEARRREQEEDEEEVGGAADSRPSTPLRRGRLSEFGTPGTPKGLFSRTLSPIKRVAAGSPAARSSSEKPFAVEFELATLRKDLASALQAKASSEAARGQEAEAWSRRVEELERLLEGAEATQREGESRQARTESLLTGSIAKVQRLEAELKESESREKETIQQAQKAEALSKSLREGLLSEVEAEKVARQALEEIVKKRPESEEEVTQREFDALVKPARKAEEAKMGKSPRIGTSSPSSSLSPDSQSVISITKQKAALDERETRLAQREAEFTAQEGARSLPSPCDHQQEIDALRKTLAEKEDKICDLECMLKERQSGEGEHRLLKPVASHANRRTSLREYRRYSRQSLLPLDTIPSTTISKSVSADIGALSLAASSSALSAMAVEAAVKSEREEVDRLNEVITSQRALMADLERSVTEWKGRMASQQEIIRKLMEAGASSFASSSAKLPTPPLRSSETPSSSTFTTTQNDGILRTNRKSSNGADDFLKRKAAFLGSSDDHTGCSAKARGGSAHVVLSSSSNSPYYGAHTFNRAPPSSSSSNYGLGLAAPSSPTKGSGLWSHSNNPDPLPLPENLLSAPTKTKRARRLTIENELEKIKASSAKVDVRTKELLGSPNKKTPCSRWAGGVGGQEEEKNSARDWYI